MSDISDVANRQRQQVRLVTRPVAAAGWLLHQPPVRAAPGKLPSHQCSSGMQDGLVRAATPAWRTAPIHYHGAKRHTPCTPALREC